MYLSHRKYVQCLDSQPTLPCHQFAVDAPMDPRLILMDIFCPLSIHPAFFLWIITTYRPIELDILMRHFLLHWCVERLKSGFGRFLSSPRLRACVLYRHGFPPLPACKTPKTPSICSSRTSKLERLCSWGVTLFEIYLLRQYPLYNKTEPPAVLASHFNDDEFQKFQAYEKYKAKFSIFSGLFGQFLGSAIINYGFYAWAPDAAGQFLTRFGYGPQYEVSLATTKCSSLSASH